MPNDVGQELLEAESPRLDDFVRETVREDLAGERGDDDAHGLALEQVAEGLEVGVASSHGGGPYFEGGDGCLYSVFVIEICVDGSQNDCHALAVRPRSQ